jgi:hypothetical protein
MHGVRVCVWGRAPASGRENLWMENERRRGSRQKDCPMREPVVPTGRFIPAINATPET